MNSIVDLSVVISVGVLQATAIVVSALLISKTHSIKMRVLGLALLAVPLRLFAILFNEFAVLSPLEEIMVATYWFIGYIGVLAPAFAALEKNKRFIEQQL